MNQTFSSTVVRMGSLGVLAALLLASCGGVLPAQSGASVPLTTSANPSTTPSLQALWTGQKGASADYLQAIAWRPDGQQIAAGYRRVIWEKGPYYQYNTGQVWDVQSGRPLHTFQECGSPAPLKWSPDGQSLLCGGKIFTSAFQLASIQLPISAASYYDSADWSPNSTQLVVGYGGSSRYPDPGRLELFDIATGNSLGVLGTSSEFDYARWSPDGTKIAADTNSRLSVYDAKSKALLFQTGPSTPGSVQDTPWRISWSADSSQIAATVSEQYQNGSYTSSQAALYILNANTGQTLRHWVIAGDGSFGGPYGFGIGTPLDWNSTKKRIAVGAYGGQVFFYDSDTGTKTGVFDNYPGRNVGIVKWSPDGNKLLVGYNYADYYDHTQNLVNFKVWDYATGSSVLDLSTNLDGHDASHVYGLSVSPDGTQLASAGRDGTVRLWDASAGFNLTKLTDHRDAVYSVAWSPDGQTLASSGVDGTVRLWDLQGNAKGVLTGHTYTVRSLAWSPDGLQLASASWDRSVRLWNPVSGTQTALLGGHSSYVNAVAYSPNGQTLASASDDGTLKLWNPSNGTLLRTLVAHPDGVLCLAWSPDGTRIATGGTLADRSVKLWNAQTGTLERTLSGSYGAVRSVLWDGKGNVLAAGDDKQLRVWNASTGELVLEQNIHDQPVFSLALSKNGQTLYSGSAEGKVKAWRLNYPSP